MATQNASEPRGRFILNNHIFLESIITELPELSDIISLSCVSNQIYCHIRHSFPLEVRKLSLTTIPAATDAQLLAVFNRHLQDEKGFKQRKSILDGGGTITIGGGSLGAPYSGSFSNLTDVDLSGTNISTFTVKVLIAATAGGKVPGLTVPPSQAFYKDFAQASYHHDLRLLKEQGLRLTRLSVKNCRNVNISKLIYFLRRVLAASTQEAKIQRNQAATNNGNNAGNNNHHIPEPLQHLGLLEEDITATPGPLPGSVEELAEYGLPCFSLRTLEVVGVDGLQLTKKDEFIVFRNLASLNTIAGCLGLEIDAKFCQGAGCAHGVLEDPDSSDYCVGEGEHHRDSYKRPLPYLPGERFLVDSTGRIFRIPKHCLPPAPGATLPPQPPQPPQNQAPPPAQNPPQNPGLNSPPWQPPIVPANTHGFPQGSILHIMQQHHQQLQQQQQYHATLQQHHNLQQLMNQNPPPPQPPPPPPPANIPQQPGIAMMRRVRSDTDPAERQGRQVRRVAMLNGPRGLCEGCGRELWLCETCNTFWVLYCGGCAARNPTGSRDDQQEQNGNGDDDA